MLSRTAENLYWLARYIERAENIARLFNVQANLMLDLPKPYRFAWQSLVDITGSNGLFMEHYDEANAANVQTFLLTDKRHSSSISSSLHAARENLRASRDGMPKEAWEEFNEFYQNTTKRLTAAMPNSSRYDVLNDVIAGCQQFLGLIAGTMDRNEGFYFMRLGRNLERADMTARIIDVRSANLLKKADEELTPYDSIQWMSVLKSLSGYQSYRCHTRGAVIGREVLTFLVQNSEFPRAIQQCIDVVEATITKLPNNQRSLDAVAPLRMLIDTAPMRTLADESLELHQFIDDVEQALIELHQAIAASWFSATYQ